jgi:hypothetical protein
VKGAYNALRIHLETKYLAAWSKANKDTPIMQPLNKKQIKASVKIGKRQT